MPRSNTHSFLLVWVMKRDSTLWVKSLSVTIHMKANEKYVLLMLLSVSLFYVESFIELSNLYHSSCRSLRVILLVICSYNLNHFESGGKYYENSQLATVSTTRYV